MGRQMRTQRGVPLTAEQRGEGGTRPRVALVRGDLGLTRTKVRRGLNGKVGEARILGSSVILGRCCRR